MHATDFASTNAAVAPLSASAPLLLRQAGRISRAQAELSRLVGQGVQLPLALADAQLSLHLSTSLSSDDQALPWQRPLLLRGAAGAFQIGDGARLLQALTGIDLDAVAAPDGHYPAWFVAALTGRLAATPLAALQTVTAVTDSTALAASSCQLTLRLLQQGHAISVPMRASAADWLQWLAPLRQRRWQLPLAPYLSLLSTQAICLAQHRLPWPTLRTLAAGDIVLPTSRYFSVDGNGVADIGARRWRVRYQAPGALQLVALENRLETEEMLVTVTAPEELRAAVEPVSAELASSLPPSPAEALPESAPAIPLSVAAEQEPDAAAAALLDQVLMTLSFELGQVSLPLAQLRSLAPLSVLSLQGGAPDAISIRCGTSLVGCGEVVDVDGVLGVRITQWGGPR